MEKDKISFFNKIKKRITKKFLVMLSLSLILSLIATWITYIASLYIHKVFVKPPIVKDLGWIIMPYFPKLMIVSESFMVLSCLVLFIPPFNVF